MAEEFITSEADCDLAAQEESVCEAEAADELIELSEEDRDYASVIEEDLAALRSEFSELGALESILDLKNPIRYAALRDLGLTPAEAYLATEGRTHRPDNRAHLKSSVPTSAAQSSSDIPRRELEIARELFSDLSDREIRKLYKKVKG